MGAAEKIVFQLPTWIRGGLLPQIYGISEDAARKYRDRGIWLEGVHWKKDPVGRIVYNPENINKWFSNE
ncbi:excisionase family protein [Alishewanella sp. 16-MA]|uniref:Excisionase family protein n=1 Tax=Alishewanella maricola TaxID=2795740 RepID=A0ABS8C1Q3_9ALTE|nr:excisionase family protein [Alishewanella maricola]MCB5226246.1 excisionase family protein [Alishewanella maricola]